MPSTTFFFFFNDTATTEIYTLSLHDALPILAMGKSISGCANPQQGSDKLPACRLRFSGQARSLSLRSSRARSEEHTSELQSHLNLVCRLLLEKKKKRTPIRSCHPLSRVLPAT